MGTDSSTISEPTRCLSDAGDLSILDFGTHAHTKRSDNHGRCVENNTENDEGDYDPPDRPVDPPHV